MVQFLPLPVIGGYLGFVGYFCIASGLGLACSIDISELSGYECVWMGGEGDGLEVEREFGPPAARTWPVEPSHTLQFWMRRGPSTAEVVWGMSACFSAFPHSNFLLRWLNMFTKDALTKLVPAVLSTVAMMYTMEHFTHPLALTCVLSLIVLAFHGVRLALGYSLEDAMDGGWVLRPAVRWTSFSLFFVFLFFGGGGCCLAVGWLGGLRLEIAAAAAPRGYLEPQVHARQWREGRARANQPWDDCFPRSQPGTASAQAPSPLSNHTPLPLAPPHFRRAGRKNSGSCGSCSTSMT